ncbi:MAG: tetratricopeptide repeat protein [Deltaproteobacteria bacterium]
MRIFFALLLVLAMPRVAFADDVDLKSAKDVLDGFRLVEAWRIDEAREIAERLLKKKPDDAMTLALVGEVKMHLGDYAGAVHAFREARRNGAPEAALGSEVAAEAARVATQGYVEHISDSFIIRHPPGKDAVLVPFAVETLEAAMDRIGGLLGWRPKSRIIVDVYPTAATLAAVSSLTKEDIENSGTIALCRWNRLMVTTPRAVVFGYSWRDTVAHELAHLIIGGASKNTVPIWLHEGIAKFSETAWRGEPGLGITVDQQVRLREAAKKKELIPFAKMHPSMAKLPTQEATSLAFSEVFTFIEFLVEQKGWAGMRRTLTLMSGGMTDAEAIEEVHGKSLAKMERLWKKALLTRSIKNDKTGRPVKGDKKIVLKDRAETPDDKLHGLSKEGRRFARAADLLFARGRVKAAQRELEKAFDATQSPLISAKLAMVALANGDLDRAEKAARAAMDGTADLAGPNVTLAEVFVRAGNPSEARLPLARAIDINPFDPRIHRLTLAIEGGEGGDPDKVAHAKLALAYYEGGKPSLPTLGQGGLIEVEGAPFSRVFLERDGKQIATSLVTPTPPIALLPGAYELVLVPPTGPVQRQSIEVLPAPNDGTPQEILTTATGS